MLLTFLVTGNSLLPPTVVRARAVLVGLSSTSSISSTVDTAMTLVEFLGGGRDSDAIFEVFIVLPSIKYWFGTSLLAR